MYRNLKAEMARAGLNSTQMAEKIGITKQGFSQKISGQANWNIAEMQKIQEILDNKLEQMLSLDYLFEFDVEED